MTRYEKGARGERELLEKFRSAGYSVVRSAGSGVNSISPDILIVRKSGGMAFECKVWDKSSISIDPEKFCLLKEWETNTNFQTYIAWRMNGLGWFFIRLDELTKGKNYTVTRKRAIEINRRLENLLSGEA
ncbi:MAG: hypothetical protein QXF41_02145 [Candidatus Micrarchaeaceae archaeon]